MSHSTVPSPPVDVRRYGAEWERHPRFPFVFERASGSEMYDTEGRTYIDFTSCSGAAPLGAGDPNILNSQIEALRATGGIAAGPVSAGRIMLEAEMIKIFPFVDRFTYFRTGSCATDAAVRIARKATGRRHIVTAGFHGWHDWQLQYRPHLGLPDRDTECTDFGYDLVVLREHLENFDVAGVIITPEVNFYPPAFFRQVAELTRAHGALLVVDEVMTGFRYAAGGYSRAVGVEPDLICVSKGIANGVALSAVGGKASVMDHQNDTYMGNTFQREMTPFHVGLETLRQYRTGDVLERIRNVGRSLLDGLNDLFSTVGVAAWAFERESMFDMVFADADQGHKFCTDMWESGYLMQYGGRFLPAASTTSEQVSSMLETAEPLLKKHASGGRNEHPGASDLHGFAEENFASTRRSIDEWWREK